MDNESTDTKGTKFLKTFCYISFVVSLVFIGGSFFGLKQINDYIDLQLSGLKELAVQNHQDVKDMPMYNFVIAGISSISGPVVTGIYLLIGLSVLNFISVFVILRLKRAGFYVFAFANVVMCSGMVYAYLFLQMPAEFEVMRSNFLIGTIVSIIQITIFALQLKNLK